jgi:hypothetical protein
MSGLRRTSLTVHGFFYSTMSGLCLGLGTGEIGQFLATRQNSLVVCRRFFPQLTLRRPPSRTLGAG